MTPDLKAVIERGERALRAYVIDDESGVEVSYADLRALLDAVKELERDAKRYRWLRKPGADNREVTILVGDDPPGLLKNETVWYGYSGEALDAAIDAALAKEQP